MNPDITNTPETMPRELAWLGYGGLVPFVGLLSIVLVDPHHGLVWADAMVAYGAIILGFVGALHWGFAMSLPGLSRQQRRRRYVWSVVPALLAWPATLFAPWMAALVLVPGFILHYLQDRRLATIAALPTWYLPLRLRLSVVGCLCLCIAGALTFY